MRVHLIAMVSTILVNFTRQRGFVVAERRRFFAGSLLRCSAFSASYPCANSNEDNEALDPEYFPPWNDPNLAERAQGKHAFRSRQHVNPLARRFQMQTIVSDNWPRDVFSDMSKPMFLDIGCSRGGFLLDLASQRPDEYNYLGLEIRPIIAYQAQQRVETHGLTGVLSFLGCNANVDLDRLLELAEAKGKLEMVTIQFPDPHFKSQHAKRRVVTEKLVLTLAQFMPENAVVFLQSDVQSVLDDMREQFRNKSEYFRDERESPGEYLEQNLLGIPTEREVSVLQKDLPVYRAAFKRTGLGVDNNL